MMFIKAIILIGQGPDRAYLTTNKPSPFKAYCDPLCFSFEVEAGNGHAYVKEHFGLDAEIINRGAKLKHFKD